MVNKDFEKAAKRDSGSWGGDVGSKDKPSIWLCGIEPGGTQDKADLVKWLKEEHPTSPQQYAESIGSYDKEDYEQELRDYPYNRNAMKLLCAVNGGKVEDYKAFVHSKKPFTKDGPGYFALNLYPVCFPERYEWDNEIGKIIGFNDKNAYWDWMRDNRFPILREWAKIHQPKVIICGGADWWWEFEQCFGPAQENNPPETGIIKWFRINNQKTLVVISYHFSARISDEIRQQIGNRIRELLAMK